jgi:hypothetical protein
MRHVLLALFAGALVGCQTEGTGNLPAVPSSEPDPSLVADRHVSRDSLDWRGMYEGLLACADGAGIHTRLTLDREGP